MEGRSAGLSEEVWRETPEVLAYTLSDPPPSARAPVALVGCPIPANPTPPPPITTPPATAAASSSCRRGLHRVGLPERVLLLLVLLLLPMPWFTFPLPFSLWEEEDEGEDGDLYRGSSKKKVDPHPRPGELTPMVPFERRSQVYIIIKGGSSSSSSSSCKCSPYIHTYLMHMDNASGNPET